ncbi:MAG: sulfite exporter TauE/SafE family protein, partial [archaeon]
MKKIFKITGMHCNSCSNLIEESLKEIDGVKEVSASYSKGKAEVDFDSDKVSEKQIRAVIEKQGYSCSCEGDGDENVSCVVVKSAGEEGKSIGDKIGFWFMIGALVVLAIVAYVYLSKFELSIPNIGENTSLILLFGIGVLTGFHCFSMCGGFVVSYTARNALNGNRGFGQHLVYGGSKLLSYTIIGGIFGLIGGIFAFSVGLRAAVAIFAGVFMIFYSLGMMGIGFFKKFQFNPKFLTRAAASAGRSAKGQYSAPLVTGLLNGLFIACGPLQAMYIYAAGTGSFFNGAAGLFAFGLGTLPIMLGFGSLATVISQKTTKRILKISAIIVLILGLVMLNRGLTVLGSPYSFDSIKASLSGSNSGGNSASAVVSGGVQVIDMNVDSSGYSPSSFVLKNGVPVKWNVNVKQLTGCNQEIILRDYGIDVHLKQGLNSIEFTPTKTGTASFSCGMGMLRGSFIVTESGTATQEQIKT